MGTINKNRKSSFPCPRLKLASFSSETELHSCHYTSNFLPESRKTNEIEINENNPIDRVIFKKL